MINECATAMATMILVHRWLVGQALQYVSSSLYSSALLIKASAFASSPATTPYQQVFVSSDCTMNPIAPESKLASVWQPLTLRTPPGRTAMTVPAKISRLEALEVSPDKMSREDQGSAFTSSCFFWRHEKCCTGSRPSSMSQKASRLLNIIESHRW